MKLPELKQNFKFTLLSVACLSGLVSCYPVSSSTPAEQKAAVTKAKKPAGLKSADELAAAKKKKDDAAAARKSWLKRNKERLDNEEKKRLLAEKKEASDYKKKVAKKKSTSTYKPKPKTTTTYKPKPKTTTTYKPKPKPTVVKPASVKFAAPVPGKTGFVYNPYTHNQVDVRGIPSGTKVRDPHDSNPSHIFKVP